MLLHDQTVFTGRTAAFKPAVAARAGVQRARTVAVRAEGITGEVVLQNCRAAEVTAQCALWRCGSYALHFRCNTIPHVSTTLRLICAACSGN